jgi:biopolymer transport protein TolR
MDTQSANSKDRYRTLAEINMVPLIDISLVLLIIFMVMTPILVKSQLKVELPKASAVDKDDQDKPIEIQVMDNGAITIDGLDVPVAELELRLQGMISDPESQSVLVQADKSTAFEHVVAVMDAAKKLGVSKIGIGAKTPTAAERRGTDKNKAQGR